MLMLLAEDAAAVAVASGIMLLLFQRGNVVEMGRSVCVCVCVCIHTGWVK